MEGGSLEELVLAGREESFEVLLALWIFGSLNLIMRNGTYKYILFIFSPLHEEVWVRFLKYC